MTSLPGADDVIQGEWPLDATTTALFGAFVAEQRTQYKLAPDAVAHQSNRSEGWIGAVERGEVQLTPHMVIDLGAAFESKDLVVDFFALVAALQQEPFGSDAERLRERLSLSGWVDSQKTAHAQEAEISIADEAISQSDRLLVIGPIGFLGTVIVLVARMLSWCISASRPTTEGDLESNVDASPVADAGTVLETVLQLLGDVLIPAAVVAGLAAVLTLQATEKLLRRIAAKNRTHTRKADLKAIETLLKADGIGWAAAAGWNIDSIVGHISLSHREAVRKAANRATFTERVEPAILLGAIAATVAAIAAVIHQGPGWYDLGPAVIVIALLVLLPLNVRESNAASGVWAGEISRGLGWKLGEAQEKGLRAAIRY